MAESDLALSTQDAQTANVRVGGVENRLSESDRLARAEARLAEHDAVLKEREKAEVQAQTERQLAAAAIQTALGEASSASSKALEAALKNANELEIERVGRVRDEVAGVKAASVTLVGERQTAQQKFEENVKERFSQVNEFRGSLEDLGKSMGTRRELEQLQETQNHSVQTLAKEVSDLRSRIDIGPKNLAELQTISDKNIGAETRGRQITTNMIMLVGVFFTVAAIAVTLIIKFA